MADENIKELCMKIYQHHKQAIDLIIENLPNQRDAIAKELKILVSKAGLVLDDDKVQTIRFISKSLDIGFFHRGSGWTKSGRMVLFEFLNTQNSLQVGLYLGPGDDSKRSQIFTAAQKLGNPFNTGPTLYAKWNCLYKRSLLEPVDYMLPTEDLLDSQCLHHQTRQIAGNKICAEQSSRRGPVPGRGGYAEKQVHYQAFKEIWRGLLNAIKQIVNQCSFDLVVGSPHYFIRCLLDPCGSHRRR